MAAGDLQMIPVLTVFKNSVILKNIFLVSSSYPTSINSTVTESKPEILDVESVLLIGRHPDCDIVLQHPCVSRFHLRIHVRCFEQKLYLFDLSSVHGTRISDRKIEPGIRWELRDGESFRVGGSTRVYELQWMPIDRAYDLENSIVPSVFKSGGKPAKVRYQQIDSAISKSSRKVESQTSMEMNRSSFLIDNLISNSNDEFETETSTGMMNPSTFLTDELISDSPNNIELETSIKIESEISNEPNRTASPSSSYCEFTDAEINISDDEEEDDDDDTEKISYEMKQLSNSVEAESSSLPFPNTNSSNNEEQRLPSSPPALLEKSEEQAPSEENESFSSGESTSLEEEEKQTDSSSNQKSLTEPEEADDSTHSNNLLRRTEEKQEEEEKREADNGSNSYQNSLTDVEQTDISIPPQISLQVNEKEEEEEEEKGDEIDPNSHPSSVTHAEPTCMSIVSNIFLPKTKGEEEDFDKIGSNNHHNSLTMDEQADICISPKPLLPKTEEEYEIDSVTVDEETDLQPKLLLQKIEEEDKLDPKSHDNSVTEDGPTSICAFPKLLLQETEKEGDGDEVDTSMDENSFINDEKTHFCEFPKPNLPKAEEKAEELEKIKRENRLNHVAEDDEQDLLLEGTEEEEGGEKMESWIDQTSVKDEKTELFIFPELVEEDDKVGSQRYENSVGEDDEEMMEMHYPGWELKEVTNIRERKKRGKGKEEGFIIEDRATTTTMGFSRTSDGIEVLNIDSTRVPPVESNPVRPNPRSLQPEPQRHLWRLVVDTTTLSDEKSRNSLRLLRGLRRTRLHIPGSVVRDLDRLSATDPAYFSALWWIEEAAAEMPWWVCVGPRPGAEEEEVLEFALHSKGNGCDRLVLLSNDPVLKTQAAAHPEVVFETVERFHRSLVNPFSKRFLWPGSTPRGRSWTYVDDVHLRSMYGEEGGPVGRRGLRQLMPSY